MIEAANVYKSYKNGHHTYEALKGVDFHLNENDCVAITGKSGSGKSTLLHLLACLDAPSSGSILYRGSDVMSFSGRAKDRLRSEDFGFIFQRFFLNGRDSVFDNVAFPLRIRGVSTAELSDKTLDALETVGLVGKKNNRAGNLSGGEQQRVCIARAIVGSPKIVFADEPTGNLDSHNSLIVEDLLFSLNREKTMTLVIVTHDKELAAKCHRTVELRDGKLDVST